MTQKKILIIVTLLVIALATCLFLCKKNRTELHTVTMCFTRNTEDGGSQNILMNIRGEKVDGRFDYSPSEKDSKKGNFKGTISSVVPETTTREINALWETSGEGVTQIEELKIIIGGGIATPGFGEMKKRDDGVYVYADPEKINYSLNLSLIDCSESPLK